MCLKFQLTNMSALFNVAVAIWMQSTKLGSPTTFRPHKFEQGLMLQVLLKLFLWARLLNSERTL